MNNNPLVLSPEKLQKLKERLVKAQEAVDKIPYEFYNYRYNKAIEPIVIGPNEFDSYRCMEALDVLKDEPGKYYKQSLGMGHSSYTRNNNNKTIDFFAIHPYNDDIDPQLIEEFTEGYVKLDVTEKLKERAKRFKEGYEDGYDYVYIEYNV